MATGSDASDSGSEWIVVRARRPRTAHAIPTEDDGAKLFTPLPQPSLQPAQRLPVNCHMPDQSPATYRVYRLLPVDRMPRQSITARRCAVRMAHTAFCRKQSRNALKHAA
jgi:hypothetical protein